MRGHRAGDSAMTASLLDQRPDTLLSIRQTAPLIRRTYETVRRDVTRRPEALPAITRIGYAVSFRVGDVKDFIAAGRTPRPEPLRTRVKAELRAQ